ncbi:MAG: class I SAM-dependent methyltransferase [Ilumatobacter sp.]|nr:class I SAM-dependent methyltransferase [bacterium]NKB39847.1 class I SAM-dependent methyltransferase [Ilumatobacter sp.]
MELVANVEGWMSPGQAATLFEAAVNCPSGGVIVEIGSFRGRSTIVLATAADPSVQVVAIDPHAGNDRGPQEIDGFENEAADDHGLFAANLAAAGVADRVRHIREFSDAALDVIDHEIDVLYIDGAHRYAPARADICAWGDRVNDGGTMLIHDSFSSVGVTLAILRSLVFGGRFRYVGRARSMTIYRADLSANTSARLRNAGRQLAQLPWFVRNVALKVLISLKLVTAEWPY